MKEKDPLDPKSLLKHEISPTRKILVWIFIIGFWIAFYWFQGNENKSGHNENKKAEDLLLEDQPKN